MMLLLLSGTVDVAKRKVGAEFDDKEAGDTTRLAVLKAAVLTRTALAGLIAQNPAVGAKLLVKITQLLAQRLRNTSNQVVKLLQNK